MEKHHNQLWYTPQEALGLLEPRYLAATKELIADKLKDGLIVAHAAQVWDSFDGSLDDAWRNREEAQADEDADLRCDVIVETWIWRRSRHWQSDLANWRWPERRFVITCRMRGSPERTFLEDVAFRKNDIDRLTQPPSKRGGRKTHHTRWAELFHE
ncbi:MAG: hypothetical protein KKE69_05375, partial [Alphaproteobacteria bacterium]|nr:hypothetical protein [Alphaproteobacteria bacterium]